MVTRQPILYFRTTCTNGQRLPDDTKTFPLQNQLIFETIPLTAEAPVSRPWWLGYPDCPCTTLATSARSATRYWVPGRRSRQVKKLYIGNLPFSATEDQLHEYFSQIGVTPSGVNLIRDRFTGQSRGFAFVELSNDDDADRAVNSLNGQNFGGRNLVVNEAAAVAAVMAADAVATGVAAADAADTVAVVVVAVEIAAVVVIAATAETAGSRPLVIARL
jgi:RNA recognition motif. (a.k.a. RRM, RBD, or RNP domain)